VNDFASVPVSVVIPAFNAEAYVAEAIASVSNQTLRPREVIVVDDGSTDRTAAVAEAAGAVVVQQKNAGVGAARNAGAAAASHPWLAFLDADDCWRPEKIAVQYAARALAPDVRLVSSDYLVCGAPGEDLRSGLAQHRVYRHVPRTALGARVALFSRRDLAQKLPAGNFLMPSLLLLERTLVTRDAPFLGRGELRPTSLYYVAEDLEWALRALRFTDVVLAEEILADYRRRPGNLSASAGRMRYGDVKLGDVIAAEPARYVAGALEATRRVRHRKQREAVLAFLVERENGSARVVLGEMLRERRRPDDVLLLALASALDTALGRAAFAAVRAGWRHALKPAIARFARTPS